MKFLKKIYAKFQPSKEQNESSFSNSKTLALSRLKEIHNYDYTTFVAKHYRKRTPAVWKYSKENNLNNYPLNLVVKLKKDIFLISCNSNIGTIKKEDVQEFEEVAKEFLSNYKLFKNYNIHYLYACSENSFDSEALDYMRSMPHLSYTILKEFQEEVA